jgi:hypothetical protein
MKLTIAMLVAAAAASAQAPMTVGKVYDAQFKNAEDEFVPLAEAMPEDKYNFKPTGGALGPVRTFGDQIKHVATVNYIIGSTVLGQKPPRDLGKGENGPDDVKGKAAIIQYLKESFAYAHKAMLSLTSANEIDMIASPWGSQKVARVSMAIVGISHPLDHYGQMAIYARMNGVVPPASK